MTTRSLQTWIAEHGPPIAIDGLWGPQTRRAVIEVFRNTQAPAVSEGHIAALAERLGCTPRQIKAVAAVEGAGSGWDRAGLLKCLWERHYLWRRVRVAVPLLSNPNPGGYTTDADGDGINDSWEKLADATGRFGFGIAAECASFGKFQVMGANWKALGYPSVLDFVWGLSRTEAAHYEAFARYIEVNGLAPALRRIDGNPANARAFARSYNGPAFERLGYPQKIASAWSRSGKL